MQGIVPLEWPLPSQNLHASSAEQAFLLKRPKSKKVWLVAEYMCLEQALRQMSHLRPNLDWQGTSRGIKPKLLRRQHHVRIDKLRALQKRKSSQKGMMAEIEGYSLTASLTDCPELKGREGGKRRSEMVSIGSTDRQRAKAQRRTISVRRNDSCLATDDDGLLRRRTSFVEPFPPYCM